MSFFEILKQKSDLDKTELTSGLVMHHTGKVLDTKLALVAVLRGDVVGVQFVL